MGNNELTYQEFLDAKKSIKNKDLEDKISAIEIEIDNILRNVTLKRENLTQEKIGFSEYFFKREDISDTKKDIIKTKLSEILFLKKQFIF